MLAFPPFQTWNNKLSNRRAVLKTEKRDCDGRSVQPLGLPY